jgi:outer membrane protein assembly factor BamB
VLGCTRAPIVVVTIAVLLGGLFVAVTPELASGATPASAKTDVWPTFGHDPLHSGVSSDTAIAASTAPSLRLRWSAPLGSAKDEPSPVVAYSASLGKTVVYATTFSGVISAFNAATGSPVWQRSLGSQVTSSPAVRAGILYIGTQNGTLQALSAATGAVRCTFTLPVIPPATTPGRIYSSPVVGDVDGTGPTVFFGDAGTQETDNAGHLWAITGVGNTAGGCQPKWAYNDWPNKGPTGTYTGVWDEPALVQNRRGRWEVVFGSGDPDESVYALDAVHGSRLWRFQTLVTGPNEDIGAGPTIGPPGVNGLADGAVYIDGKDGIEYALNLRTGSQIWSLRLGAGTHNFEDGISKAVSEAALTGRRLLVCYAAKVFALNANTGAKIWTAKPGLNLASGGDIQASPALAGPPGQRVLFAGDLNGDEFGLLVSNGSQVFAASPGGKLQASSAVAAGTLYFDSGGTLYAYAPPTGRHPTR